MYEYGNNWQSLLQEICPCDIIHIQQNKSYKLIELLREFRGLGNEECWHLWLLTGSSTSVTGHLSQSTHESCNPLLHRGTTWQYMRNYVTLNLLSLFSSTSLSTRLWTESIL
jgi:hypothetical protein